jgi:alpha-glucosidase
VTSFAEPAMDAPGTIPRRAPAVATGAPWWKAGVIYHVYVRSFADASGDGVGDLRGLTERLDHLNDGTPRSLGVSAVWLSPIYPSPNRDVGYDVADYTAIDPACGGLEDFDALVAACRQRDIQVVMDLVLNHTSDLHPWFESSRAGRGSDKRDWYIWRDPAPGGRPPNNWRSWFGGSAWTLDEESGQYYLHTFLPEQPDLNWHNPEVRAAALDVVRFWLERGVSGFRLDVFNAYFKHPELPSNPRRLGRTAWARQRHVYNKDRPEVHDFLAELRELLDAHDAMAVGEAFEGDPELVASYCDKLHMAFNFDFLGQEWSAKRLQSAIRRWDRLLTQEHLWPSWVLSNHDHPRHARRYGRALTIAEADARAKVAAALMLTLRGTPFVYYGEEIGMQGADLTPAQRWDLAGDGFDRDTARTPMQWSGERGAGFSAAAPWLPLGSDYRERNVADQDADPRSILSFYRQLIWLRRASPALQTGSWTPLLDEPRTALAYLRRSAEQTMLVLLNLSGETARVRFAAPLPSRRWTPRLSTSRADIGWSVPVGRELLLRPYEATVLEADEAMHAG